MVLWAWNVEFVRPNRKTLISVCWLKNCIKVHIKSLHVDWSDWSTYLHHITHRHHHNQSPCPKNITHNFPWTNYPYLPIDYPWLPIISVSVTSQQFITHNLPIDCKLNYPKSPINNCTSNFPILLAIISHRWDTVVAKSYHQKDWMVETPAK